MTLEQFLEHYDALVVGNTKTESYHLVLATSGEVFGTFETNADVQTVNNAIAGLSQELPIGKHVVRLQALAANSAILGQYSVTIDGRSGAARQAVNDDIMRAKATAMNVATANTQLENMTARLSAADERARTMEDRAGSMLVDMFTMSDMVHKMILEKESREYQQAADDKNREVLANAANALMPMLGPVAELASRWLEIKIKNWEKNWSSPNAKTESDSKKDSEVN